MSTFMRTTARRAAVGLGALALAAGATACGGDDGEEAPADGGGPEQTTEEQQASDDGGSGDQGAGGAEDTAGEDGADEPLAEEDLTAAKERFIDFMQVIDDSDYEAACGFVLDPATGEPAAGPALDECAATLEESMAGFAGQLRPGMFDQVDSSMIDATDNGDGTVTIALPDGTEFPQPLVEGGDGQWYLTVA